MILDELRVVLNFLSAINLVFKLFALNYQIMNFATGKLNHQFRKSWSHFS